jgi:hypothetical protein
MDSSKPGSLELCGGGHKGQVVPFMDFTLAQLPNLIRAERGTRGALAWVARAGPALILT